MVLKIGDTLWYLHFRTVHVNPCNVNSLWSIVTTCHVHTGVHIWSPTEPRYCVNGPVGEAKCSKKDNYNRRIGNRLALANAIKGLPYETKKAIWDAYWQRVRFPKESSQKFRQRTGQQGAQAA